MKAHSSGTGIGRLIRAFMPSQQVRGQDSEAVRQATEHAVDVADPVIRQASRYRKVLQEPVAGAMQHFQSLSMTIPGPVTLSRDNYHQDPVVKALFASPDELEEVLRINPALNKLRQQGRSGTLIALMTMLFSEKTMFGYQQSGETIMRDVAQRAVSFSDHRIVAPGSDLEETRAGVVSRGLEVLATLAMERITTMRARKAELQEKREYLKGMHKILGGRNHRLEMFAAPGLEDREKLRKVEQALAEVNKELEALREEFATPEHALGYLETIMREADRALMARPQSLRLDWKGVRVDNLPDIEGNDITLAEFSIGEDLRRSAVLVSFTLERIG